MCIRDRLYRALDEPRREFHALLMVSVHCMTLHDRDGAQAASDQARALLRPEWEPEMQVRMLRNLDFLARWDERTPEALKFSEEAVQISVTSGDWRLEVMQRTYHCELLWLAAPLDEAAHAFGELARAVHRRPVADADMMILLTMRTWLLSEAGRMDEALAAALEALPYMGRNRMYSLSGSVHLLWRLGQLRVAAQLLGALEDRDRRKLELHLVNEDRLLAEARTALAEQLSAEDIALEKQAGARLGTAQVHALVASTLTAMRDAVPGPVSPHAAP